MYELRKGYSNAIRGTYVHPKLINYIAIWASPGYAVVVGEIMDKINEFSHAIHQTFDETKDQLIAQMRARIDELSATVQAQEIKIHETAVPEDNSNKLLTIFRYGGGYKISANSTQPQKSFIIRFVFPASMNFKQEFKKRFGPYSYDSFNTYVNSIERIREQGPKSEIVGDQVIDM
jgi:hypothetical protein